MSKAHDHQKRLSTANKALAELHRQAAKADEFNGDYKRASISRGIADIHDALATVHAQYVPEMGSTAPAAADHWTLGSQTIDSSGNSTKAATAASWFNQHFGSPAGSYRDIDDLQKSAPVQTAGNYKDLL